MVPSHLDEALGADGAVPVTEEERARLWWASRDIRPVEHEVSAASREETERLES